MRDKNIKFQKFRFFLTEVHDLLSNINVVMTKEKFLEQLFANDCEFNHRDKSYKYSFLARKDKIILGKIGRFNDREYYSDENLSKQTLKEYTFLYLLVNIETDNSNNLAQTLYLQSVNSITTSNYLLLKAFSEKIKHKSHSHRIQFNPENKANINFWHSIENKKIDKLIITYAPKNLFNHSAINELSKEMTESLQADEMSIVIENNTEDSSGLNLKNNESYINEVLEDTSKGALRIKATCKRKSYYDSTKNNQIVEKDIQLNIELQDTQNNDALIQSIINEILK